MSAVLRVTLVGIGNHVSNWADDKAAFRQLRISALKNGCEPVVDDHDPDKGIVVKNGVPVGDWKIDAA